MTVRIPWIMGLTIRRVAEDVDPPTTFDDFGSYPVTYMDGQYCRADQVRIQVMHGGRSVMMRIPLALYRALRSGEYVADEG